MKKIGLYFGSFNPLHNGHLMVANYAVEMGGLDELWFVPTVLNPQKDDKDLVSFDLRVRMIKEVLNKPYPTLNMFVCDIEKDLPSPHYTYQTIQAIQEKYKGEGHHYVLIMGMDSYESLPTWKNYQELLKYQILILPRWTVLNHTTNSMDISVREQRISYMKQGMEVGIHDVLTDMPMSTMSSSFIRNEIKEDRDIRFYVPPQVWVAILKLNLYKKL